MFGYILKRTAYLIPPAIILGNFTTVFLGYNETVYTVLCSTFGTSFFTCLLMIYVFFYTKNYCWFTKLSVIGVCVITVLDLVNIFMAPDANSYFLYSYYYTIIVTSIVVGLGIYYTILKK